jgi:hypothetical protein
MMENRTSKHRDAILVSGMLFVLIKSSLPVTYDTVAHAVIEININLSTQISFSQPQLDHYFETGYQSEN